MTHTPPFALGAAVLSLDQGVENLPVAGMGRCSAVADGMSMQRIALVQDAPNAAKRPPRSKRQPTSVRD